MSPVLNPLRTKTYDFGSDPFIVPGPSLEGAPEYLIYDEWADLDAIDTPLTSMIPLQEDLDDTHDRAGFPASMSNNSACTPPGWFPAEHRII